MFKACIFQEFLIHILIAWYRSFAMLRMTINKKGRLCEPTRDIKLFQLAELFNRDLLLLERNDLANCSHCLLILNLIENSAALFLL